MTGYSYKTTSEGLVSTVPLTDDPRIALLDKAAKEWAASLIDSSGNNRLLYYQKLKQGTLDLSEADETELKKLLVGRETRLSRLFPVGEDSDHSDYVKKARALAKKDLENFEEKGLRTLFLAVGMAKWTTESTKAEPAAPILMRQISLTRSGAAESDYSLVLDDEWDVNQVLLHHLKEEFQIPSENLEEVEGMISDFDTGDIFTTIDQIYSRLVDACTSVSSFAVDPHYIVGNFTYAKQAMVKDLLEHIKELSQNALISAIAGDENARKSMRTEYYGIDDPQLSDPDRILPRDEFLVLDADSSQNFAINAALAKKSIIIQGPPGTGKSQTIANLISTAMARGRTVLFVAEKRAAIDAVMKRLTAKRLDMFVMDLHGSKAKKAQVAKHLAEALATIGSEVSPDVREIHRSLQDARSWLNQNYDAVHRIREPWGVSFAKLTSDLIGLEDYNIKLTLSAQSLEALTEPVRHDLKETLRRWNDARLLIRRGASCWQGANVQNNSDAEVVDELLNALEGDLLPRAKSLINLIARHTGLPLGSNLDSAWRLVNLIGRVHQINDITSAEIWTHDLNAEAETLRAPAQSLLARMALQIFSPRYRRSKSRVSSFVKTKMSVADLYSFLQELKMALEAFNGEWADMYPGVTHTFPDDLRGHLENLALKTELIIEKWNSTSPSTGQVQEPEEYLQQASQALDQIISFLPGANLKGQSLSAIHDAISTLRSESDQILFLLPSFFQISSELREASLDTLMIKASDEDLSTEEVIHFFDYAWKRQARRKILLHDSLLREFNGDSQDRLVEQFCESDSRHLGSTPQRVRRAVAEHALQVRNAHPTQDELIKAEAHKKRRHKRLQELFDLAPELLTSICPCWTMSPLAVSEILPGKEIFDLVIFDEASQIIPAEAIPALLRGKQAVVAGDSKQLPPTTFFDRSFIGDDETDDSFTVSDFESVLDVLNVFLPAFSLRWHYRSLDEKLIAFSNSHIYNETLFTFPGAISGDCLDFELIEHRSNIGEDTRSNPDEVERVVDLMIAHARKRPKESLGVITMGIAHANHISDSLRRRMSQEADSELEVFFDEGKEERTFVKSIESVQGDERDAILLSVGYRKQDSGVLRHNFGPINREGGERRINVAVTRARRRLKLISSFSHNDIDLERTTSRGVELLQEYLKYVESGGENLEKLTDTPLNPFESEVYDHLKSKGLDLTPQYGVLNYRLDFAVKHPDNPARYVLAIEADGASYHSSKTARDRDRLRQQQLERLGWTFYRIWSTDWFNDRESEIRKVLQAYEQSLDNYSSRNGAGFTDSSSDKFTDNITDHEGMSTTEQDFSQENAHEDHGRENSFLLREMLGIQPGLSIKQYPHAVLVSLIEQIKSDGRLRTDSDLLDIAADILGKRKGKNVVAALRRAIRDARGP